MFLNTFSKLSSRINTVAGQDTSMLMIPPLKILDKKIKKILIVMLSCFVIVL